MFRESTLKSLLEGRRILIAGYGREGKSTHKLLQRLFPDRVFDVAENDAAIHKALQGGPYDLVLKSPGIPMRVFEGFCDLQIVSSQTDLFLQVYGDRTVGVTGTKGKSTTASLIFHLMSHLSQHPVLLAGNIGIPLFDILDSLDDNTYIVAELSCHQLENIHRGPHIGIVLNLFQEHLDHYRDYMGYKMAKLQMGLTQQAGDHFLYCSDNEELRSLVESLAFSSDVCAYDAAQARPFAQLLQAAHLSGDHNLCNLYVALKAAGLALEKELPPIPNSQFPVSNSQFSTLLQSFAPLEHRMECVGSFDDISFYNDSISTIPAACIAAVEALKTVDTLILGGFDRGIDYAPLALFLQKSTVRNLVFVGQAGRRIAALLDLSKFNILFEDDYRVIVDWCFTHTAKGGICLLSPAAASYDAFRNFEQRGSLFKDLVRNHRSPMDNSQLSALNHLRRNLHDHPGVSGCESFAHDTVVEFLNDLQPSALHTHVGGYGVVAQFGINPALPTIAFRADIDALPIGHRCGHDGHTATLLHFAQLVSGWKHPSCNVLLVFQPEEETGLGAAKIVEMGLMQKLGVSAVFGMHNLPGYPMGQIVMSSSVEPSTFAAASSGVVYHLEGRSTHASTPELGLNPGLAVSDIISAMALLNRPATSSDFQQATLICVRLGDEAFGTSAANADVMFTLRAFSNSKMDQLLNQAHTLVQAAAEKHHLQWSYELREPFRATENTPSLVTNLRSLLQGLRYDVVEMSTPFRWSEDFSQYLDHFPGVFFGVGAGIDHVELHNPDYDFPDELISKVAQIFFDICTNYQSIRV